MKSEKKLACCFFPTTVVVIDDDVAFLNSIKLKILNSSPCKIFRDPQNALISLKKTDKGVTFINQSLLCEEDDGAHRIIKIDIDAIHQQIYNSERFDEIAVVVVDYAMPGIDGAEVCRQLQGSPYKIILLTGEASVEEAVQLFNDGVIDLYIRKGESHYLEKFVNGILELQHEYFIEFSEIIVDSVAKRSALFKNEFPSCLNDPVFIQFFHQFLEQHQVKEYYLIEESGSFLLVDPQGNLSWLLVKSEGDMLAADDEARFDKTIMPLNLRDDIFNRKVILHFFNNTIKIEKPDDWKQVVYPATKLQGNSNYYYCHVKKPLIQPDINKDKIASYGAYLSRPTTKMKSFS